MTNLAQLEATYQQYAENLSEWLPDGMISVDLSLLQRLDLLEGLDGDDASRITHYFHVVESPEKITLFNEHFAIWIVPELADSIPVTYALIALRREGKHQLEMGFSATGVYNTSRTVLRVLEKLLDEIRETEQELERLQPEG